MTAEIQTRPVYIDTKALAQLTGYAKNTIEVKRSKGDDLPPCYPVGGRILYDLEEVNVWIKSKRRVPSSVQLAQSGKGA
jgi:predicted DNA-binding transcriptional regulator AlpA